MLPRSADGAPKTLNKDLSSTGTKKWTRRTHDRHAEVPPRAKTSRSFARGRARRNFVCQRNLRSPPREICDSCVSAAQVTRSRFAVVEKAEGKRKKGKRKIDPYRGCILARPIISRWTMRSGHLP